MLPFSQFSAVSNRIISLLSNSSSVAHIHQIQAQLILHNLFGNSNIASHFIYACQSLDLLNVALLLSQLPKPHVFISNSLIRVFSHSNIPHIPFSIYTQMHKNSLLPNNYTFPFLLKSLSDFHNLKQGQCVHTHILKLGHNTDIYVQNSLLGVYASCGELGSCQHVFTEMPLRDVVSWTVLIMGYRYARRYEDALIAFEQMQYSGIVPNHVTMVNALAACANFRAYEMGVWIHDFIKTRGWEIDVILGTSLIQMYGKCGRMKEGLDVFESMKLKNVYTWNTMIQVLALAKSGEEAIWMFNRMKQEGMKVDEITLIGVLCACSHSGLVNVGMQIFTSLVNGKYGFLPSVKHYACMVDLFARAGWVKDAMKIISEMPYEPIKSMWGSLLNAGRASGNMELSEFAARKLVEMEPENSGYYVLLSNICAEMGRWSDVEELRGVMRERGLKKELGSSSVDLQLQENVFELLPH